MGMGTVACCCPVDSASGLLLCPEPGLPPAWAEAWVLRDAKAALALDSGLLDSRDPSGSHRVGSQDVILTSPAQPCWDG